MEPIHILALILGGIATAIPKVESALPLAWKPWLDAVTTVSTLLVTLLVPLTAKAEGFGKKAAASISSALRAVPLLLSAAGSVAVGGTLLACSTVQAVAPYFQQIANILLADLAAGKTYLQIETDVASAIGGQAGVDVVVVLNDVITFLIDDGVIPPGVLPQARSLQAAARAKLSARGTPQ